MISAGWQLKLASPAGIKLDTPKVYDAKYIDCGTLNAVTVTAVKVAGKTYTPGLITL